MKRLFSSRMICFASALTMMHSLPTIDGLSSMLTMVAQSKPTSMPRANAFLGRSRKRPSQRQDASSSRTRLEVLHKRQTTTTTTTEFLSTVAPILATSAAVALPMMMMLAAQSGDASPQDPAVEAEVLTDLAHVTLDVATLFGPSSKLGIRLSHIVGRLFVMAADYVPDHVIVPEEMVFQLAMLCVASIGLIKSALPVLLAAGSPSVGLRQGKVYCNLMAPTGMSWHQFKAMDVLCMDWITIGANETLDDGDDPNSNCNNKYVYWLYSGDVLVSEQGRMPYPMAAVSGKRAAEAFLGEVVLLQRKKASDGNVDSPPMPSMTLRAGSQGATLLRINVPKLRLLMKADKELEECMRTLAFQSLQSKLITAQFAEA